MRGMLCELNNSCYSLPQNDYGPQSSLNHTTNSTDQLTHLTQLIYGALQFANQPQVINSTMTIAFLLRDLLIQRNQAIEITRNLKLSEYTYTNLNTLTNNINLLVNSSLGEMIINSSPNYNYLYSNYSQKIFETNFQLETTLENQMILGMFLNKLNIQNPLIVRELIDLLYGQDLDVRLDFSFIFE